MQKDEMKSIRKARLTERRKIAAINSELTLDNFWVWYDVLNGKEAIICKLIQYEKTVLFLRLLGDIDAMRKEFNQDKSKRLKPNDYCIACGEPAKLRHHIIQLQHGGTNERENIVAVCHSCNHLIHPWLSKHIGNMKAGRKVWADKQKKSKRKSNKKRNQQDRKKRIALGMPGDKKFKKKSNMYSTSEEKEIIKANKKWVSLPEMNRDEISRGVWSKRADAKTKRLSGFNTISKDQLAFKAS